MKITKKQQAKINHICKKHHNNLMLLHGSQLDNTSHERSDIDIALKGSDLQIMEILSDLYKVFKDSQIDPVDVSKADPLLLSQIANKSQLLFESEEDHLNFQLQTFHRYNDYQPYFQLEQQNINNYLNSI